MAEKLPTHLKKYIVTQDYDKYTAEDHAVWRYCLRQLKKFLSVNAHESYLEGLKKTGITIDRIPKISEISACIENFGWRALPVSGFIPPAAFMEMQALGILPIASDMRSVDHLLYTPAPDIVHEAAGHAPIIVDPEYAEYLKQYSQVAKKALISKEDLDLYEAIRILSDAKENPHSTEDEIKTAEEGLNRCIQNISHVSEATLLSRMNWWTAEYGLIGDIKKPKIFGAGLLSSVGESRWCLSDNVKKIPLTIDCINQTYDITEPQPQLFVTPDFKTLVKVLNELSQTMAYKVGGTSALDKAKLAQSVNTVELDTGFQISSVLKDYILDSQGHLAFIKFDGPTQISIQEVQLSGHSTDYHQHSYSTPLGQFSCEHQELNQKVIFKYDSGFIIEGVLIKINTIKENTTIYTFKDATATYQGQIYFKPEWGNYDVVTGSDVVSVFGGPADRSLFGDTDDFQALKVPTPKYSEEKLQLFSVYQNIRNLRNERNFGASDIKKIITQTQNLKTIPWLVWVELLELAKNISNNDLIKNITTELENIKKTKPTLTDVINDGISSAHA